MKKSLIYIFLILALVLVGCRDNEEATLETDQNVQEDPADQASIQDQSQESEDETKATSVTIVDQTGEVEVPVNPQRVVSLDNRTFETLDDWGVKLVAAPKPLIPDTISYANDDSVEDIGNHREPNLEVIAAVDPDIVIVGQRFVRHYDEIKSLVPNATVINLNIDVSENAENPGQNLVNGFIRTTEDLGKIFEKEAEADKLIEELNSSIEAAKTAYNPEESVMSLIISGGEVRYSAPGHGRVWGPLYEILGLSHSLDVDNTSSNHMGDDISLEAIAETNPDWLLVLDRDAGTNSGDAPSAQDVLEESQTLQNTNAIQQGNIVYAPNDTYTNESIQTFIEIFNTLAENFAN